MLFKTAFWRYDTWHIWQPVSYFSSLLFKRSKKNLNMLWICQNSQVQLLCVYSAWEFVGGHMSACVCVCVWVHADGPLLQQQQFIFYQSGLITHNMTGQSIPHSPFSCCKHRLCVTALSSMANMPYQSRPHQSVFMKTWLTLSVSTSQSVTISLTPPLCMGPLLTDEWHQ